MCGHCLEVARHNSDTIIRKGPVYNFEIVVASIEIEKTTNYFGMIVDSNLSFEHHIERTVEKASRTVSVLIQLIPNVEGPSTGKKRVLLGAVHSVIFCKEPRYGEGCCLWEDTERW